MPVYGKGRIGKKIPAIGERGLERASPAGAGIKKRIRTQERKYGFFDTRLEQVNETFKTDFAKMLKKGFRKKKKKLVVVDACCGTGKAIIALSKECEIEADYYGLSKEAFESWEKSRNVKFVQAVGNDFKRYFKDNSIDLMFSYSGLNYYFGSKIRSFEEFKKNFLGFFFEIRPKFAVGGKLYIANLSERVSTEFAALRQMGWQTRKIGADAFLFTRAK